jgi:hypothetical protein
MSTLDVGPAGDGRSGAITISVHMCVWAYVVYICVLKKTYFWFHGARAS